ncbi:thymidine kinase [Aerococcaceae bacterium DSM 111020]|nr:thymidine kinase [Aerococcaceae bacterium DSM 111020]
MAKLYFKHGAMNSGKSLELIKVAHNYEEQNKPVLIFTSALDTRSGEDRVSSRVGFHREAVAITETMNLYDYVKGLETTFYCILIDEAQFLGQAHVLQLTQIVDQLNIPVMAFGLKNDFSNHLFEGSEQLLIYADKIEEMKTICWFCDKKATMNLRISDGKPVYAGEQIQIGGNESYIPVCRACYQNPDLSQLEH